MSSSVYEQIIGKLTLSAEDSARLSPDLFIVFAGNNEAVGPYGPATVFGQGGLPVSLVRASNWIGATRIGQQLTRMVRRTGPGEWRGLEMFSRHRIEASDPRLLRMYSAFEQNLDEIVRIARRAGAEVLLVTVPVNLRDFAPFAPSGADFAHGRELLAAGRATDAEMRFRRARDLDQLRFRADTRINDIIRTLVDVRDNLDQPTQLEGMFEHARDAYEAWLTTRPNMRPGENEFYGESTDDVNRGLGALFFGQRRKKGGK